VQPKGKDLCGFWLVEMPFVPSLTQIVPRWIHRNNQLHLLNPQPAFDPLAVNRVAHIVKTFVVNESINLVALAEFRSVPALMFPNPAAKVIGDSDVERLRAICENVNAVVAVVAEMHRSFPFGCAQRQDDTAGIMRDEDAEISEGCTSKL
jgi:hypothetical protein